MPDALRMAFRVKVPRCRCFLPTVQYSSEKIGEYQRGLHLFVDGVRGATREAGWDVDEFEIYTSHTCPLLFTPIR